MPAISAIPRRTASYAREIGVRARISAARGEELDHLVVVLHAARLLHALLHAREARRARAFVEALRRAGGLFHGLDAALPELGLLLRPQLRQGLQAFAFVL